MNYKPENCKFKNIKMINQTLTEKQFNELFHNLYNNVIFSTFPYTVYKESDSKRCISKYNSGNCIALAEFVKYYLEKNYNLKSHIIGASVPPSWRTPGTPHMTHCAVIIPLNDHKFCIFDPALYFLTPMYCNLRDNVERTIETANVYEHTKRTVKYIISKCDNCRLDEKYNQILHNNSLCVTCMFEDNVNESWNYYLNEITNPDNNIGVSFLQHKKEPFMMYTTMYNRMPIMKYKLKLNDDGLISVKKYPDNEIIFNGNSEEFDRTKIKREMNKYFSKNYSF